MESDERTALPPGLPVLLVPAVWLFGTVGAHWEAWLLGVILLVVVWGVARDIGGDLAAAGAEACFLRLGVPVLLPMLGRRRGAWIVALVGVSALAAFQLYAHGNLTGYTGHNAHFGLDLFGGTDSDVETRRSVLPTCSLPGGAGRSAEPLCRVGRCGPVVVPVRGGVGL
jgi:hypothetical protein